MQQIVDELEKHARNLPHAVMGIKALVLDDSVFDRRRIRRLSHDTQLGIILDEIESLDALESMLDQDRFDVILIDYNLPDGDGFEALKRVRSHAVNGKCPAIMVTGEDKTEVAVKSFKMGCADYITKDQLSAESLRRSVMQAIEKFAENEGREQLRQSDMERATATIMGRYTSALQPRLARVIRELRSLKRGLSEAERNIPGEMERIERQCIQIWAALLDPGTAGANPERRH